MKLDKYKILKHKLAFFFLCFGLLISLLFITKISDLWTESVEIQAEVVKTFRSSGAPGSGGPKMNIEWVDLDGEVQKEGSLYNGYRLEVGDTYTIRVDTKTQSRRVLEPAGSIVLSGIGLMGAILFLCLMKVNFGKSKISND